MRALVVLLALATACSRAEPPSPTEGATAVALPPAPSAATAKPAEALASNAPAPAASSAAPHPRPPPEKAPKPPEALLESPPRPSLPHAGLRGPVDPSKDRQWLERLTSAPITEIVRNPGGATITLRVKFADGSRAVFKPEQKHSASNYRSEIAAYHVDRLLGFARTAAVAGRTIGFGHIVEQLEAAGVDPSFLERFRSEVPSQNGQVAGAMIAWHAGRLTNAEPPRGWTARLRTADPVASELERRLPEWSDLLVFDFLIDNTDRWSGGNVLALGGGGLIFLDNAAGFAPWRSSRGENTMNRVEPVCRFRKATRDALAAAGPASAAEAHLGSRLERSLAKDPLAPVLGKAQFAALDARVARLLEHVAECQRELGDGVVLLADAPPPPASSAD